MMRRTDRRRHQGQAHRPSSLLGREARGQADLHRLLGVENAQVRLATVPDGLDQLVHLALERMVAHVGAVRHQAVDPQRRASAAIRRVEQLDLRERVGAAQLVHVERLVLVPGDQGVADGRLVAHELDAERVGQHEVGGAGDVTDGTLLELHVRGDGGRPLVALGEARVQRAHLDRLQPRAPAQRVHGMTARGQEMAAAARLLPHPVPPGIPVRHAREVLHAREADAAQPPRFTQPVHEAQVRVVVELEGDDGADLRLAHGIADANQLAGVEAGRLLEDEVLARARGGYRLGGVEVVGGRDGDDVHLVRLEEVLVARGEPRARQGHAVAGQLLEDPRLVPPVEKADLGVRVLEERLDVLGRAPADAADPDAEGARRACRRGHPTGSRARRCP